MTFSITARCARTGQLGVAVATGSTFIGWWTPYVQSRVGAVASQARVNPYVGIWGLRLLSLGWDAQSALDRVLQADPERERRQAGIVDAQGRSAGFTGSLASDWKGHRLGDGFVAAGNTLVGPEVVDVMAEVMTKTAELELDLGERLLRALEAGHAAGGDRRGHHTAALRVMADEAYPWADLRVDDHPDPVVELRRLATLAEERRATSNYYRFRAADLLPIPELTESSGRSEPFS
jgi:uncharacterized Ntn-hydrolase superfamily protein